MWLYLCIYLADMENSQRKLISMDKNLTCDNCGEEIEQGHLCPTCQNEILDDFKEEE